MDDLIVVFILDVDVEIGLTVFPCCNLRESSVSVTLTVFCLVH